MLGSDLVDISIDRGILQVATNIGSVEQQLQEDLNKQTVELQNFYENDLCQYASTTSRQPSHQNLTTLARKSFMAKWTFILLQQNNVDTSSRPDGSSDLDHHLPQLMTSMTLQDLLRQDLLPRDAINTSRNTSSKHSQQHLQVHHYDHYFYIQYYSNTKSHHVTSHQRF